MKYISKHYKGDITLFITIIASAIMLILLSALSQRITIESRISRENLYSQQALQVANTGIDAWEYQWVKSGTIDIGPPAGMNSNWPNGSTTGETIITDDSGQDWIEVSRIGGSSLQYRVEFQAGNTSTGTPPRIISRGRVDRGNTVIERTLQQEFNTLAATTPTPTPPTTPTTPPLYVGPPVYVGTMTHFFNNGTDEDISLTWTSGIINVISESKTAPDGMYSTGAEAKHYTITLPPTNNYSNLVVTAQYTAGGAYDPGITAAKTEKISPTLWKVWFNRSSGYNTYVRSFEITGQ